MAKKNIFYAQSGGVTAVINATACGLIETAREHKKELGKVLVGRNGILGALHEELIDTSLESKANIRGLRHTPAGAFGSCRYKLKSLTEHRAEYERLIEVFAAHDIGYFFYNGGGDSQDTTLKMAQMSRELGYPLQCIGIPKTVDNDLPITDNCPGFGSVAKYVAVSIREAGLDVASMAETSTKVFVMEVMGRHAGWIAAAAGLAATEEGQAPHLILLPEVAFDQKAFLAAVNKTVKKHGFCAIVVSEGLRTASGEFVASAGLKDAFGHTQLGGVAPVIAQLIKSELGYKYHWAVCDYLQRAARHIASATDVEQAYTLGQKAIEFALQGKDRIMLTLVRKPGARYRWSVGSTALDNVANQEKTLPKHFITKDGFGITKACKDYLEPLIQGEDYPPYKKGLPQYVKLNNQLLAKKIKRHFQEKH